MKKLIILLAGICIVLPSLASAIDMPTARIWDNNAAQARCPQVCRSAHMRWNGQWTNRTFDAVCGCKPHHFPRYRWHPRHHNAFPRCRIRNISAGPIWNNADAHLKCPNVCEHLPHVWRWTGQWKTVVSGQNSMCECEICHGMHGDRKFWREYRRHRRHERTERDVNRLLNDLTR